MEKQAIVKALAALAQETRLDIFRYLVEIGPAGVAAGSIAERLALPSATLSFHLKTLKHAGLIECERQSRQLIYRAHFAHMNELLGYLSDQCCSGNPAACGLPAQTIAVSALEAQLRQRRTGSSEME